MYRLKKVLKDKGITVYSLAKNAFPEKSVNTSSITIARFMNGKTKSINIEYFKRICEYLDVSADYLLEIID